MISRTKYTKNILVGSPAVLVRDEIHCNEYPGTRRVMNVGYPGSKISTRFNPNQYPPLIMIYYKIVEKLDFLLEHHMIFV